MELGCEADDGYNAGDSREGTTRRWMVWGDEEASCCWRFFNIEENGDEEPSIGRGIAIYSIAVPTGSASRFARSKP